eukprot:gene5379-9186_t
MSDFGAGWESKPHARGNQGESLGDEDDTDQVIMRYKDKDYTLEKFSEKIQDLGIQVNKIKKYLKGQNKQQLEEERKTANNNRELIKNLLQTFDPTKVGKMLRQRVERIKGTFEQIDEKLELIDRELQAEEEHRQRKIQEEDIDDENDDDEAYGQNEESQRLIEKQEEKKSLTGWQARYIKVEKDLAVETLTRVQDLEGEFRDLNTMFKDMDALVDRQGEGLDVIEENVDEAVENVEVAVEKLKIGVSYLKGSAWKTVF